MMARARNDIRRKLTVLKHAEEADNVGKACWGGMQVVPEDWVSTSTDSLGIMSIWANYGYQWCHYGSRMVLME